MTGCASSIRTAPGQSIVVSGRRPPSRHRGELQLRMQHHAMPVGRQVDACDRSAEARTSPPSSIGPMLSPLRPDCPQDQHTTEETPWLSQRTTPHPRVLAWTCSCICISIPLGRLASAPDPERSRAFIARTGTLDPALSPVDQAWSRKLLQKSRSTPLSGSMNESRLASNCNGAA